MEDIPSPNSSQNSVSFPSKLSGIQNFSMDFASMYHSIFPPISSLPNSLSFSPSPRSSADDDHNQNLNSTDSYTTTDDILFHARIILEYCELRENHDICLRRLRVLSKETDYLHRENVQLRLENTKLVKLISSKTGIDDLLATQSLLCYNEKITIGSGVGDGEEVGYDTISPTSVILNNQFEGRNGERIGLPKSISVRSIGYVKANEHGAKFDYRDRSATPPYARSPLNTESRLVRVPASDGGTGKRNEEAKELEIYNQGMVKTEICNKWQETSVCPYGGRCRFAHGIKELRPVMRHPRYKTEVCRMVLAGEVCPYAHRCHFRHSLSEQEREK